MLRFLICSCGAVPILKQIELSSEAELIRCQDRMCTAHPCPDYPRMPLTTTVTPPPPRSPPPAGRSRPGCGRHRHCRRGPTGDQYLSVRETPAGKQPSARRIGALSSRRRRCRARCAGRGAAARLRPSSGRSRSRRSRCRIAIMASQKRSSSAFDSDSVGSIISVPGTGKLMVGAWKP